MRHDIIAVMSAVCGQNMVTLYKGIQIPEPMNLSVLDSRILSFGTRNPAPGILNSTEEWNPESSSLNIHSRWYYPAKFEAIHSHEGKVM